MGKEERLPTALSPKGTLSVGVRSFHRLTGAPRRDGHDVGAERRKERLGAALRGWCALDQCGSWVRMATLLGPRLALCIVAGF